MVNTSLQPLLHVRAIHTLMKLIGYPKNQISESRFRHEPQDSTCRQAAGVTRRNASKRYG